ncbi:hypothetical protein APHCRT_1183 [Anaplasma phagocytophilum str. CRT53-1]|uniref:Uncharacterized protein n=1 Tax=Anaplasma phagocytophilum str. CRT53-1 TaxID=1359157 RepID=A0A0F3PXU0_ANAPH|nr:hypothetical protein APHCRT_1183 [Anaplasma phagocytophilum str. CRT53-1]
MACLYLPTKQRNKSAMFEKHTRYRCPVYCVVNLSCIV